MKAIVRNVLLACLISIFAMFGALGSGPVKHAAEAKLSAKQISDRQAEATKETLTCLSVAILAWVLCFWRCSAINHRMSQERMYQQRFNEYMRSNPYAGRQYR